MGRNLFNESSDDENGEHQLKTNETYAKHYNEFRKKELFKKLKDRKKARGGTDEITSSSDSESSDDDDDEGPVDPEFDKEFLKTLASLKSKDPLIYDKSTKFFEDITVENKQKSSHEKPLTLKDYERKVILEKGGVYVDDESEDENGRPISPTIAEEEYKLKEEFKKVLQNDGSDEEGDFGGIFTKREKTREEKAQEETDYLQWLAGRKDEIEEETKKKLDPLKKYWSKPDLSREDQFLRDYILNNGYINKENNTIPTYDEIVGNEDLSEDEKELQKQAEFEEKFNFRFEEPDKDFIKRYPRTIENSVRQQNEKRKQKRHEVKERKQKEKEQKFKELEMLKEMKRKEIEEKIQKLKEVTGNEELPFNDDDFNEDFDPEAHDRKMKEVFNDNFYEVDEGEDKPECPDIEDIKVEDWDNFDPNNDENDDDRYNYEIDNDNDEDIIDYDHDPKEELQKELIESTKKKRNRRKRRNRFMEMIKTEKPPFNPEDEKTYEDYIEEYYKMDCEDIIGDIPCRFKYVETVPNDFGLTIEEILLAKNKELNQWASLKKAIQIRPAEVEKRDVKLYKMRAKNEALKRKIFRSIYGPSSDEEEDTDEKPIENGSSGNQQESNTTEKNKKKRKKKKKSAASNNEDGNVVNLNKSEENGNKDSQGSNKRKLETETSENPFKKMKTNNNEKKEVSFEKHNNGEDEEKQRKSKKKKNSENKPSKETNDSNISEKSPLKKSKKFTKEGKQENKHKFKNNKKDTISQISDDRLKAYGLNPSKFRRKHAYFNKINRNKEVTNKSKKINQKKS